METWKPSSYPSLSPYLICPEAEALIAFLEAAFGGVLQRRFDRPDGSLMHAEVRIDDSIVMIGGGATETTGAPSHLHLYVPDAVAAFDRAIAAGAVAVREPVQAEGDDDLRGGVQDPWGVTWWLATQQRVAAQEPVPFEPHPSGAYLHGTKADLAVGDLLEPGRNSNFEAGRVMNHVYFTTTLDAAAWGAELATGQGTPRIYLVEPLGEFEDDPNVTDKRFPGNPTRSYRSRHPLRVVGELTDWTGHSPEKIQAMKDGLARLTAEGTAQIED